MATKLYVGGLPYTSKENELKDLFSVHGEVKSVAIIKDKFSGESKGFGFVEMSSPEEAKTAIAQLDGKELGGRKIMVNIAREKSESERRNNNFRSNGGGGGRSNNGSGSFRFR